VVGVVQRFERRLEGLVQGAFAKAFGGWVEPVEVAAALTREAEDKKAIVAAGRVLVPNAYVVELGPSDSERLREYDEPLRKELASMVSEAAVEQGWSFVGPVEVTFSEEDDLPTGTFRVRGAVVAGEVAEPPRSAVPLRAEAPRLIEGDREIPLGRTCVIGRGGDADIQLTDIGASRKHAEVRVVDEGGRQHVELHDLGSTNGTLVNGQRVAAATLTDGDRITIGTTTFQFRSGR
jgi:hypothetical protein